MPPRHQYKVIFLTRPIEEIALSQSAMIKRLHREGAGLDLPQLLRGLAAHRDQTLEWLRSARHMEYIEVDYPALVAHPETVLPRIVGFLGQDRLLTAERMKEKIEPALHRRRNLSRLATTGT